jgi:hypothetical protein
MERLGKQPEKKPERTPSRLRQFGRKMLDGYIEGMQYGTIWAPVPGVAIAHYEAIKASQPESELYDEEDGETIVRGEN